MGGTASGYMGPYLPYQASMSRVDPLANTAVPVHLLGVALMGLSLGYLWFVGVEPLNAGKAAIPFLLAATLLNTGRYVGTYDFDMRQSLHVATWAVGTLLGAGWMAFVILFVLLVDGIVVADSLFIFLTSMSGGAAAGGALGASKVRAAREREKLDRERGRVERMNSRLRVINRVLRHNFQNNLNVLKLWADRVIEEVGGELGGHHGETARGTVVRLEELTEKTRAFEAVNERHSAVEVDLGRLVEQRVADLRADHPAVTVRLDLEPGVRVRAHRMLETAVDEVLENAVQHNDEENLVIEVTLTSDPSEGTADLRIADDGTGIPDDERSAVEAGDETPLFHGSGMGLWLVRAIVTESGGAFGLGEIDPHGTIVGFRLQTAEAADAPPAAEGSVASADAVRPAADGG